MPLQAGEVLEGRYHLTEPLGRGGMAEVWGARDARGGREVAIKVLRKGAGPHSEIGQRMIREGEIMRSIQSPHVCAMLGSGMFENRLFLVFERLRGESLAGLLQREASLPFDEVGVIVDGMLEGLGDAHRAGVIHRDLTPSNVFLEHRPQLWVRLLDFGISKSTERMPSITDDGGTLGSYRYMAPEQSQAAHGVDERTDIYAAGTIAFECLAGRLPFQEKEVYVVLSLKAQVDAPSLHDVTGEQWPSDLERFLRTALERDRERRFPSAFAALNAWRAVVARNDAARSRRYSADTSKEVTGTDTMTSAPRPVIWRPKGAK
jgi:serine/threonine-protein kinase